MFVDVLSMFRRWFVDVLLQEGCPSSVSRRCFVLFREGCPIVDLSAGVSFRLDLLGPGTSRRRAPRRELDAEGGAEALRGPRRPEWPPAASPPSEMGPPSSTLRRRQPIPPRREKTRREASGRFRPPRALNRPRDRKKTTGRKTGPREVVRTSGGRHIEKDWIADVWGGGRQRCPTKMRRARGQTPRRKIHRSA